MNTSMVSGSGVGAPFSGRGISLREAQRRALIAAGAGVLDFRMMPDPEEDEDEAAQGRAAANVARRAAADGFRDIPVLDVKSSRPVVGLEDLEATYGFEPPVDPAHEDGEEDGEDGWPDEDENPRAMVVFRGGQYLSVTDSPKHTGGALRRAWQRREEYIAGQFAQTLVVAVGRRAERLAKSVDGTVVRHADYGIFVQSGRDMGLVHVDTIRGMGSRARALAFLHGNAVGAKVRVIPGAYRAAKRRYDLELM